MESASANHRVNSSSTSNSNSNSNSNPDSNSTSTSSSCNEPDRLLQSLKRQTIPTACHNCRSKKVKCDGRLPCGYCSRRSLACSYESTLPSETPQQARKRKYHELTQRSEAFHQLYNILAGEDEARAIDVFHRIRGGEDLESLVSQIQFGNPEQAQLSTSDYRLKRLFLFSLIESTATLQDVATTAAAFMANNRITVPPVEAYGPLRDRIVTLDRLTAILTDANPHAAIEAPEQDSRMDVDTTSGPIYWVPAQPWLSDTSDEDASHLISLFFSYLNHSWRFVEVQPFLNCMRSKHRDRQYCSPFLVNAIMALAVLHSDLGNHDLSPQQYLDKGIQYHDEALRLWSLVESKPSVTNIQGLTILAIESIIRGKDEQGFGLLASATTLNNLLSLPERRANMNKDELDYLRVRGCTWWMVVRVDLTYKIGLMLGGDGTDWDRAPMLSDVLPDTVNYWTGYPLRDEPIQLRANLLFHYQCRFTRLLWEATRILIWDAAQLDARREHAIAVRQLSARLEDWFNELPGPLQIASQMPPSLFDLHIQYHCIQMAIHERTYMQMFGPTGNRVSDVEMLSGIENEQLSSHLRNKSLQHCYEGATLIRQFRETYGLKFVSFVLLNHSVMGVFICLNDMHLHTKVQSENAASQEGPVEDTNSALEEFFRLLLATSLRWTLSRGLARTAYHTATEELQVKLPHSISEMVRIMAGISWQGSDLQQLSSTHYPNWSMPRVRDDNQVEHYRMGDLLKQWESSGTRQPGAMDFRPPSSRGGPAYDPVRDQ